MSDIQWFRHVVQTDPYLLAGVSERGRLLDHLPDDEAGGDEHDDGGAEEDADGVGDQGVVADVVGVAAQVRGTDHQLGGVHRDHAAVRQRLVANLQHKKANN